MTESRAIVLSLDAGYAVVACDNNSTCGRCEAVGGCGAVILARVLCSKPREYRVVNAIAARPGDKVTIGIAEDVLLKSSLAIYLVPLLLLIGGSVVGGISAPDDSLRDGYAIAGFLVASVATTLWIRLVTRRYAVSANVLPLILRQGFK